MSYIVFTDGCSNIPGSIVKQKEIRMLPCSYVMDDVPGVYDGDLDHFDFHEFYEKLRHGSTLKTSLLNSQLFMDHFRPALESGKDVIYVGLSSGISGTIQAARIAADELQEEFPERTIHVVDSLGAGFGTGLLACMAADLRKEGKSAREAGKLLDEAVPRLLQFFTVDNLMFLKRTGRVSGATAAIGTVLNIKPLLWGDPTGHIVACEKHRGRKRSLDAIAEKYRAMVLDADQQMVVITHGDCPEDAQLLADKVSAISKPRELLICPHEPFTGSHVGPGMLALFFFGKPRA